MKKNKKILLALAMLFGSMTASAQQSYKASGTVVDDTGEPVIGATIREPGTSNGAVTDLDGKFSISVSSKKAQLVFSYVGSTNPTQNASTNMHVTLHENAKALQEVVVVGYQTQKKADLTGSVAVVSTKSLKTSADTDPLRALQGRVAGVTVTSDGSPSGTGTVRIRGIGSFNASQDPLFIIDGGPTIASLNSLNMNDIESMQVLKDAASASIYGSRAANGVIIITTRKGKKGEKVKVDFSANLTMQYYDSQSKMKLCNTSEYA